MANESVPDTLRHISLVRDVLTDFAKRLLDRGSAHDVSKLCSPELEAFDALQASIDINGRALRGTPAYTEQGKILGPALLHHYLYNSHHPEHYDSGIEGMDLFDLVEMLADWRSANVERDGGAPMSLSYSIEKYRISPQLASILENTVARLGWGAE